MFFSIKRKGEKLPLFQRCFFSLLKSIFFFLILKVCVKSKAFIFFYRIKGFNFSTELKRVSSFYCLRSPTLRTTQLDPQRLPGAQRPVNTDVPLHFGLSGRHFATAGEPVVLLLIGIGQASQGHRFELLPSCRHSEQIPGFSQERPKGDKY